MSENTSIVKKNKSLIQLEINDLSERMNTLELNMVEAKEFTHLSAEVFTVLQNQINDLKFVIATMTKEQLEPKNSAEPSNLLYF